MGTIGEVIYTSTTEIIGQCRRNCSPPSYGSFILLGKQKECVGVVYNVETTWIDPNRRPLALGIEEDQIPRMHPQLAALVRSQFHALLIGTMTNRAFEYGLPQTPPILHAQVEVCNSEQIQRIGGDLGFLRMIYASGKSSTEDLLLSVCRCILEAFDRKRNIAIHLGKAVTELYRDDYDTLKRFIARLEQWQQTSNKIPEFLV